MKTTVTDIREPMVELDRLKLNFRDVKRTKRRTEERLKIAITALNMIANENTRWSEMQHMAREALSRVTGRVGIGKEP